MVAKKERPIICWRIWRPASRSFSRRNRSVSCRCLPNAFDSRMPETDSVSSVIADRSAMLLWVTAATSRRARPTRWVSQKKNGSVPRDSSVSCHESSSIATTVLITMTRLDSTPEAVSVTTDCTPPTSLERRDWISPVRVEVKNSSVIRGPPGTNRASSNATLISSGLITPNPDVTRMSNPTPTTRRRYGRKMPTTRPSDARVTGRRSASGSKWKKCPRTFLSGYAGVALRPLGDGHGSGENRVEHVLGQDACEGVLLAGVVRADQCVRADGRLGTVAEPRPGAWHGVPGSRERPQSGAPGEGPQRDHPPNPVQQPQLPDEIGQARVPLLRRGPVRRRGALDRGRHVRPLETESIVAVVRGGLVGQAGAVHRGEQPVTGAVAGEDPPGPVAAVSRRGQPHHEDPGVGVAESGHRARPVALARVSSRRVGGGLFPPCDQPRTQAAP